MNLPDALIPYDVDTRWNSTYLMLNAGIKARRQISRWISLHSNIPQFTDEDWEFLQQLATILQQFYEHTEHISWLVPQISYAVPIYYDLYDLMHDASNQEGEFQNLHKDIAAAVGSALEKYSKYYDLIDGLDIYYIALLLNPRYKTRLLEQELKNNANSIIQHIKEVLHQQYPALLSKETILLEKPCQTLEARLLSKIQPSTSSTSDIDRYFNDPLAQIPEANAENPNWLFDWWNVHKNEYPRMAAAARDYLAIPASEVLVERLFSAGRDIISLRRYSLHANTLRQLSLLRHSIRASVC